METKVNLMQDERGDHEPEGPLWALSSAFLPQHLMSLCSFCTRFARQALWLLLVRKRQNLTEPRLLARVPIYTEYVCIARHVCTFADTSILPFRLLYFFYFFIYIETEAEHGYAACHVPASFDLMETNIKKSKHMKKTQGNRYEITRKALLLLLIAYSASVCVRLI